MNTLSLRHPGETRSYARSLALSAFVHGLAIAFAVTLLSDLKLVPEPEPFKWDVAVVKPPAPQQAENPAPAQSKPAPPTPTQAEPQPVESQPVVRAVQHVVRQEVAREVRQVVQAVSQPAQTVSRTVQTIKTEQAAATPAETVAATAVETSPVAAQDSRPVTRQVIADTAPVSNSSPSVVSRPTVETA
ncbi:MAG: hypothetical protein HZA21_00200, partial [Nitrospirae bacterium]|nr:hypothetical protein [Nitrospirota bacterium]